jgi:hypothetical protein
MSMEQVKKAMDSVVAANFERKDLSDLITLTDGPIRPLLQAQVYRAGDTAPAIGEVPAKGKTHYWDEQGLIAATGATAGYQEGAKPATDFNAPVQITNVIGRFGKVAAVTDTEAAIWTGAGSYRLQDGELERMFQEALEFDTSLKMEEVLNEIEWCLIQGNAANNTATSVPAAPSVSTTSGTVTSQFNGLLDFLGAGTLSGYSSATNYGNAQLVNATAAPYGSSGSLTETMFRDMARTIVKAKTPYRPNLVLVTEQQLEVINTWHPAQVTNGSDGLIGGAEVTYYQTGFFKVGIVYEPQLPTGNLVWLNTNLIKRARLIPLGTEPLARVQTQVERMITCEMSLEVRAQKSMGVIYNLAY